jgi:hypothetical protein
VAQRIWEWFTVGSGSWRSVSVTLPSSP